MSNVSIQCALKSFVSSSIQLLNQSQKRHITDQCYHCLSLGVMLLSVCVIMQWLTMLSHLCIIIQGFRVLQLSMYQTHYFYITTA